MPRWQFCVEQLKQQVSYVLSKWFIEDYVQDEDAIVSDVSVIFMSYIYTILFGIEYDCSFYS